jgi:phosphonate transport system substrate-binding protein
MDPTEGTQDRIRFASFLAPNMFSVYRFVADYVGEKLGQQTELTVGHSFDEFAVGKADIGFLCGLPYVELVRRPRPPIELLAAPVLRGARYEGRPIYFSDVIVRADSPYRSFSELRGRVWAYNDPDSHSGYNVTRHRLVSMGETQGLAAIDSHEVAVEQRDSPALREQIKVIDNLGPAGIQPVVAASRLPDGLKAAVRDALLAMGEDPAARAVLTHSFVERFVAVTDEDYEDVREKLVAAEDADFMTLR